MEPASLWVAASGLLLAGMIKGVTGIGYSTCALPFLSVAVGLRTAMALIVAPAIASNLAGLFGSRNFRATLLRFWPFYAGTVPGIALGTYLLRGIDTDIATQFLGAITLVYAVLAVTRPPMRLSHDLELTFAMPAGFMNGLVTGTTGSQVMPLMPYFMALKLDPNEQVLAVNLAVALASLMLGASMMATGLMSGNLAMASLVAIVPALIGVGAGSLVRTWLSADAFRFLSLQTLVAIGTSLVLSPATSVIDIVALVDRFDPASFFHEGLRLAHHFSSQLASSAPAD